MAAAFAASQGVGIVPLFDTWDDQTNHQTAYTHVMGDKRKRAFGDRLRARMERDYPDRIDRIEAIVQRYEAENPPTQVVKDWPKLSPHLLPMTAHTPTLGHWSSSSSGRARDGTRGGCGCGRKKSTASG